MSIKYRHAGFSLIELMISIVLGLILMTGVIQMFISSKNAYITQTALSRVQETGRLALEFMSRDIRMAGYLGCASRSSNMKVDNMLKTPGDFKYDFATAVIGYVAGDLPAGNGIAPLPVADTDIIALRNASGSGVQLAQTNDAANIYLPALTSEVGGCKPSVDRIDGFCPQDIVVVADCAKARFFQITSFSLGGVIGVAHAVGSSPGNATTSWGGNSALPNDTYEVGAELLLATNTSYFVAINPSGRSSLYQNINGINQEVLEGVEGMSILYGVDTTADPDFTPDVYQSAAEVSTAANWSRVVSVRISLLVASLEDNVLQESQALKFNGKDVPTDRRLRQIFTTTIGIRSRLI